MNVPRIGPLPPANSIRARLYALVLTITLAITALWAWTTWSELRDAERNSFDTVRQLVNTSSAHLQKELSDYELVTELLVAEFDPRLAQWSSQFNAPQFLRLHPDVVSIGVYQPQGASTSPLNPPPGTFRDYLDGAWPVLAKSSSHFNVSGAVWDNTAKRWVAILSRQLHDAQGGHLGLLYLTLDLRKLSDAVLAPGNLDVVMPVADRNDRILMRSLEPDKWIGETLPPAITTFMAGKVDEDFITQDLYGQQRLYALKTLPGAGWRVLAGISETQALLAARTTAKQTAVLGLLALLALLGVVWLNARAIARGLGGLTQAVDTVRKDIHYRVPLDGASEVVQVAQHVNALLDQITREHQERKALSDHYSKMLNNARDFIFLLDENTRIVDCNPSAIEAYGYSLEEFRQMTAADLRAPECRNTLEDDWAAANGPSGVLFETVHCRKGGTTFHAEISSNRFDNDGKMYVQSFVRDITERKLFELALARQTRALAALSACNHALIEAASVQALLDQVCHILATAGGYGLAWVGRPEHDDEKHVRVWAKSGGAQSYLDNINISWADSPLGQGPTGKAMREVKTILAHDLTTQSGFEPWRTAALAHGFVASIALPLVANGVCLGVLAVYGASTDVFDPTEVELLEELASNVAFGMADLQSRARAVHLETQLGASDQRFQMLIEQSPAGIYVLRHGAFVYANPRMDEIMGVAHGELVGQDSKAFVIAEDWHILTDATERMNLLGSTGNLQVRCKRKDGVLIEIGLQNVTSQYDGAPAIIGMAQDISERNRAQAEIQQYILRLEHTTEATLQAVSNMVEMRDPYTAGHERRVGELAGAIGAEMDLSAHDIKGLRLAGFVHDVGKIAVPAELLAKPTRLTEAEMALIRVHSQAGYDVLKGIDFPWPIADVILQHHERIDGTGYPRGLIGAEIRVEARIMMVADVVESMSSHRPYRPGLGIEAALAEIIQFSGSRYDPVVVEACLRLFREKAYTIPA